MNISKPYRSLLLLTFSSLLAFSGLSAAETTRVSVSSGGVTSSTHSRYSGISADGRYVVFSTSGSNLVAGDSNSKQDVFLRDTQTDTTTRISVSSMGVQANGESRSAAISADGRYVVFQSYATNLVVEDVNPHGWPAVYLHDTQTGSTVAVSVDSTGELTVGTAPDISSNGRYVAFESYSSNFVAGDTNGRQDIFWRDIQTGATARVSVSSTGTQTTSNSVDPAISADGRYVVFESEATNLVAGDSNNEQDVFLHDTQTNTTTRISVSSMGVQANGESRNPAISADGHYVVFESGAANLVTGDTNGKQEVFLHDTQTGTTSPVNINAAGEPLDTTSLSPAISSNGRYVVYASKDLSLFGSQYTVILRDIQTSTSVSISENLDGSLATGATPVVSDNGRRIAFGSNENLVGNSILGHQVYLRTIELPGDCDIDGDIDVDDVICTTDLVLDGDAAQDFIHGDCNVDLFLDITDVTCTINKALD